MPAHLDALQQSEAVSVAVAKDTLLNTLPHEHRNLPLWMRKGPEMMQRTEEIAAVLLDKMADKGMETSAQMAFLRDPKLGVALAAHLKVYALPEESVGGSLQVFLTEVNSLLPSVSREPLAEEIEETIVGVGGRIRGNDEWAVS